MPGGGEETRPRGADWIGAREFWRPRGRARAGAGWKRGEGDAGGVVEEPQHAARQGAVGAGDTCGLHGGDRGLEGFSERAARERIRRVQIYQLAALLGIFGRKRKREHGASNFVDHERAGFGIADGGVYVGWRVFGEGRARGARYDR